MKEETYQTIIFIELVLLIILSVGLSNNFYGYLEIQPMKDYKLFLKNQTETLERLSNITIAYNSFKCPECPPPPTCKVCPVCKECPKIKDLEVNQTRNLDLIFQIQRCEKERDECYSSNTSIDVRRLSDRLNNCLLAANKTKEAWGFG